ncbi:hypothetical protein RHN67_05295 [Clostridioides difficile]|nr:hypothetical protein RHN67_05295 [Clostridioides difficile]
MKYELLEKEIIHKEELRLSNECYKLLLNRLILSFSNGISKKINHLYRRLGLKNLDITMHVRIFLKKLKIKT